VKGFQGRSSVPRTCPGCQESIPMAGNWGLISRGLPSSSHSSQTGPVRTAFKEWAIIVEALGQGDQILILRKGGIAEGRNGFQVDHSRFLLFPTQFHQQRSQVTPGGQALFDAMKPQISPSDRVRIDYEAAVTGWRKLASLEEALRLRGQHLWRPEVIQERFDWGREQAIFVMALRVGRLRAPLDLPMLPEYGGCRSWISLQVEDTPDSSIPVLDSDAYRVRIDAIESALGGPLTAFC
jgi:hypothetical protein